MRASEIIVGGLIGVYKKKIAKKKKTRYALKITETRVSKHNYFYHLAFLNSTSYMICYTYARAPLIFNLQNVIMKNCSIYVYTYYYTQKTN